MALRPGTRLGPYEILASIGAGGQGEVYKARDARLDRTVAIKILSSDFAAEEDGRERLKREAWAAARLNHPHICALYDIGTQDGTDFLVMELLEGQTLAQKLAQSRLPHELALEYGRQIAEALDAAHRLGIVHRDLKPGNVMLTRTGVKVLDFGLAKQAAIPPASGVSEAPTKQKDLTGEHALVGTLQYMAPEQLEGKEIDSRTDVFAFGAVLYEMLTGRKAFSGESQASLIAAILDADPPAIPSPPRVGEILKRCLAKSPDDRWQSLRDVSALLGWIGSAGDNDRVRISKRSWLAQLAGGLALTALVGTAVWLLRPQPTQQVVRLSADMPPETYLGSGVNEERSVGGSRPSRTSITLSPNGEMLVFSAVGSDGVARLFSRRLNEQESVRMEGTEGAVDPVFSPDGESVAFWSDGELRKAKLGGGLPVALCKAALTFGISWGSDDTIAFAEEEGGLQTVSASGGQSKPLTTVAAERGEWSHRLPHFLPDGGILFTIAKGGGLKSVVALQKHGAKEPEIVVENGADARYAESGHIVFARDAVLMALPFHLGAEGGNRTPVPVVRSVMQSLNAPIAAIDTNAAQFAFSRQGTLVYAAGGIHPTEERSLLWLDRSGRSEPLDAPAGPHYNPKLSHDGAFVALSTDGSIWVHHRDRGSMKRLTQEASSRPIWSPDDRDLVFLMEPHDSPPGLFRQPADGSDIAIRLTTGEHFPSSWSEDGRTIAFVSDDDLWTLSMEELRTSRVTESSFIEMDPSFSPDGNWLAYSSNESGRREVYVRPFSTPGPAYPLSTTGGRSPAWSRNGRELFYVKYDPTAGRYVHDFMVVDISFSPKLTASRPRRLFTLPVSTTGLLRNFDVSAEGRFLILTPYDPPTEKVTELQVALNWFEDLKRLAPVEN